MKQLDTNTYVKLEDIRNQRKRNRKEDSEIGEASVKLLLESEQ